jgi:hypothetical protein
MYGTRWNLQCYVNWNKVAQAWAYVTVEKVKVKVTLEQATKAKRGSRGIALLFP